MTCLERLDLAAARTIRMVLGRRAPDLLQEVTATSSPSMALRKQVESVLAEELSLEISGPDCEPTPRGLRIDEAIGHFLLAFPITETPAGDQTPPDRDLRGPERAEHP